MLDDFRHAARNAMRAGFDSVQIHAANGYLIDQFLRDGTDFRNDPFGGSIANRVRLLREVTQVVADTAGADRTGVRLTPNGTDQAYATAIRNPYSWRLPRRCRRSALRTSNCASLRLMVALAHRTGRGPIRNLCTRHIMRGNDHGYADEEETYGGVPGSGPRAAACFA